MRLAPPTVRAAMLLGAFLLAWLGASTCSPTPDAWRQLLQVSPNDFEGQASRTLASALNRLTDRGRRTRSWHSGSAAAAGSRRGAALRLLVHIWRQRNDAVALLATCDALAALLDDDECIDELEAFLPQLAHLVTRLPADWLITSVLERFILHVCESNVHWALQLTWIAYGGLEENRPEESRGDAEIHARCAALLQRIEQAVVYGAKMVNRDSLRSAALAHNVKLWLDNLRASLARAAKASGADASLHAGDQGGGRLGPLQGAAALPAPVAALATARALLEEEGHASLSRSVSRSSGAPAEAEAVIEGWLLKRKVRDSFGVWRCCGESWNRRWFSLRECVLYYRRGPADCRARGAIPLSLCHVEMRDSPRVGEYIRLSARFSRLTLRVRGETPEQTATWLRVLRAAAGLPPLSPPAPGGETSAQQCSDLVAASLSELQNEMQQQMQQQQPGAPLNAAARPGSLARAPPSPPLPLDSSRRVGSAQLSTSQRCSWLYLTAQRDFARTLAAG